MTFAPDMNKKKDYYVDNLAKRWAMLNCSGYCVPLKSNLPQKSVLRPHRYKLLLGVNYYVNFSINNRLYCTKWAHSHVLFDQLLRGLRCSIMGYIPIFHDCVD